MPHDDAVHQQAALRGDYADEVHFDEEGLTVSLIHFADDSHGVRLDLLDRGIGLVLDTPAWLDLDTVVPAVSVDEPTLSSGYAIVEREEEAGETAYRLTIQGGDVVGRISVVLLEAELGLLRRALAASREWVESADEIDHQREQPNDGLGLGTT